MTLNVYAPGATPETDSIIHKVTIVSVPVGGYSLPAKRHTTTKPVAIVLEGTVTLIAILLCLRRIRPE